LHDELPVAAATAAVAVAAAATAAVAVAAAATAAVAVAAAATAAAAVAAATTAAVAVAAATTEPVAAAAAVAVAAATAVAVAAAAAAAEAVAAAAEAEAPGGAVLRELQCSPDPVLRLQRLVRRPVRKLAVPAAGLLLPVMHGEHLQQLERLSALLGCLHDDLPDDMSCRRPASAGRGRRW
jgi:hypothetical protein